MKNLLANLSVIDEVVTRCPRLFIACDFDGTLAPIQDIPSAVALPVPCAQALQRLSGVNRVQVAIVSGRSLADLRERVSVPVILAGNHGLEIQAPGWTFEHKDARTVRPALDELFSRLKIATELFEGALLEDKYLTATVHYRLVAGASRAALVRTVRSLMRDYAECLSLRSGRLSVEIHPKIPWNKGSALEIIRLRSGLDWGPCICFGDDRCDDFMFNRYDDAISVVVGDRPTTAARFRVDGPAGVVQCLNYIADAISDYSNSLRHSRRVFAAEAGWKTSA